jgi:hypothetical protein
MGLFAQAGAAMPLPPAQAEAIYDLSLDGERIDDVDVDKILTDLSTDEVSAAIRQSALKMVKNEQGAMLDREHQTVLVESPELPTSVGRTKS